MTGSLVGNTLSSADKGAANGIPNLNASAKVPTSQLPVAFGQFADTFAGATADIKLNACLAAATNNICNASGLTGAQTLAATVAIPANTTLQFCSITATTTITNGTPLFTGANNASLLGCGGAITTILTASTANISSLATNLVHDGTQNTFNISGITFQGNASATIPQMIDLQAIYDPSYFSGNTVICFPSIGVHVRNATGAGFGPVEFGRNTYNGSGVALLQTLVPSSWSL